MQKRLVFPGFPCTQKSWEDFLPQNIPNIVVPFSQILAKNSVNIREMAKWVAEKIIDEQPSTLICHDNGGLFTLLALLHLKKKKQIPRDARLIVLNTAFRNFDVFQNTHPFKIQLLTYSQLLKSQKSLKSEIDPEYATLFSKIKSLYRLFIMKSLWDKVSFTKPKALEIDFEIPSLFLKSTNDPFISSSALESIAKDFKFTKIIEVNYGHFPQSSPQSEELRQIILDFETAP